MKLAATAIAVFAFLFMATGIVLCCSGVIIPGLACLVVMALCIAAHAHLDPAGRLARQRRYRRDQRRQAERTFDGEPVPKCAACRVIVFPGHATERVPCHWHADIKSVAIERQVHQ